MNFWESLAKKYEDRVQRLTEKRCQVRHRVEVLQCIMPALMCSTVMAKMPPSLPPTNRDDVPEQSCQSCQCDDEFDAKSSSKSSATSDFAPEAAAAVKKTAVLQVACGDDEAVILKLVTEDGRCVKTLVLKVSQSVAADKPDDSLLDICDCGSKAEVTKSPESDETIIVAVVGGEPRAEVASGKFATEDGRSLKAEIFELLDYYIFKEFAPPDGDNVSGTSTKIVNFNLPDSASVTAKSASKGGPSVDIVVLEASSVSKERPGSPELCDDNACADGADGRLTFEEAGSVQSLLSELLNFFFHNTVASNIKATAATESNSIFEFINSFFFSLERSEPIGDHGPECGQICANILGLRDPAGLLGMCEVCDRGVGTDEFEEPTKLRRDALTETAPIVLSCASCGERTSKKKDAEKPMGHKEMCKRRSSPYDYERADGGCACLNVVSSNTDSEGITVRSKYSSVIPIDIEVEIWAGYAPSRASYVGCNGLEEIARCYGDNHCPTCLEVVTDSSPAMASDVTESDTSSCISSIKSWSESLGR